MRHRAFTLIELLVVIAVLVGLMGLLTPALSIARKASATTATQSLLRRVTGGIDRFRDEIGVYPYQDHQGVTYPEANRLAARLAADLDPSQRADLMSDLALAAGRYLPLGDGSQIIGIPQVDPRETNVDLRLAHAYLANRMAGERARVAVLAGHLGVTGLTLPGGYAHAAAPLVPNPRSAGWTSDYLGVDLQTREVRGDSIVDRWGTPLIYICPVVPGIRRAVWPNTPVGNPGVQSNMPRVPVSPDYYGVVPRGRAVVDHLASDLRTEAAAAFAETYELWSAGPDRRHEAQRDAAANRDDIAAGPYLRGLR